MCCSPLWSRCVLHGHQKTPVNHRWKMPHLCHMMRFAMPLCCEQLCNCAVPPHGSEAASSARSVVECVKSRDKDRGRPSITSPRQPRMRCVSMDHRAATLAHSCSSSPSPLFFYPFISDHLHSVLVLLSSNLACPPRLRQLH